MESGEQGAGVALHMVVVLGDEVQQQPHLLLLHCLQQEAIIIRQEESTPRLACTESAALSTAGWRGLRANFAAGVDAMRISQTAITKNWAAG